MDAVGPRILVADDDVAIRDIVVAVLAVEGYAVLTAADGWEALSLACSQQLGLILIELNIPYLSGTDFCHLYREQDGTTPVILLTADNPHDVTTAIEACGAVTYIPKPFDLDELLGTVARYLPPTH